MNHENPTRVSPLRTALLLAAAILAFAPLLAFAGGPGTSSAAFLKLGFGARPLGMGEAFVATADDASALHYNPAGLAYPALYAGRRARQPYELMVSHSIHVQDIRLSQMGIVKRPWGLSVTHLTLGGIERRTSETARPIGSFGASDLAIGVTYGRMFRGIGVGGTMRYVKQSIGEFSATAYALDIGALHRFKGTPLSVGASLANAGTQVTFVEKGYPLPRTFRLGATYGLTRKFPHALSLQLDFPRDNTPALRIGLEYVGFGPFSLRAGYRTMASAQRQAALGKALGTSAPGMSEFYGMFMGAGFRTKMGSMDYTILPYGELGNAHRFSLTLRFGGKPGSGPIGVFR